MDNINVSVIVPVYNNCEYIESTLSSIINQNFDNFEIIVIDDGSTDNSLEIVKEKLSASDISYQIIHQENAGVSCARNRGIEVACGDYLVFVDADDYISQNHLSELYNGETDFSLIQLVKREGNDLSIPYHFSESSISCNDFIKMELNMEIPFNFCQLMYKTDIVKKNNIKFTPNIIYGEDTEFALKALSFGDRISISNEVTYYYIQHEQSAIRTSEFKRFEIVGIFENLAQYYKNQGKTDLANLIITSRIPKAIFGNMNYFFYNNYDFDDVIAKMHQLNLFTKLSKFEGDFKFKFKIRLFLLNPKIYYKIWRKVKNSID
ncbi:Glycosyltransferase involved in cell wall bisynthesis [Methanobrevibacter gottschalkii]|uniref:Glycosyltransferase involved in cell wall bisynthesis n=1 Tax=Methanobrevibacter gottschalkii TaxID=190974 RepID=A0A1H7JRE4_9EURY|nr:glycosyltransferase [Methanobrevibacter gottschalkii]MCQ2970881.1 glycosyltransferase [archaeon]SEK77143.1 Glycosyltransferase involved in cell wall bisynthesis [Methanobrevibacter gottschalkii]